MVNFRKITNTEQLDELVTRSNKEPVVIFKHSTMCPVSATAYRALEDYSGEVALVEIQTARQISNDIGTRTGIEHESPQVIVLRNGEPVWHASHWKVTAQAVEQAMQMHAEK